MECEEHGGLSDGEAAELKALHGLADLTLTLERVGAGDNQVEITTAELARTIIRHIANSSIEIAVARHDLESQGEPVDVQDVVNDLVNVLTGDDTGCLEPEDLTKDNCELLWLVAQLKGDTPIPMVLHCPTCGHQHVDAPEPEKGWTNPPHKSHLCAECREIWRPADVPTVGVASVATRGSADTWPPIPSTATVPDLLEDCAHHRNLFLQGSLGSGGRESVNVCRDCGQFHIVADREGVHFSLRFSLWGSDALIAASQKYRAAIRGDIDEGLSKRVWKPLDFAGLRLYRVVLSYTLKNFNPPRTTTKHYIVAATRPREAASLVEDEVRESYEGNSDIAYWNVAGYPVEVLQPIEWTENGISILNEGWLARILELEAAIKKVITQTGDDLCWMDIYKELASLVGIEFEPEMLPREQMLANCTRFVDSLLTGTAYTPAKICGETTGYHIPVINEGAIIRAERDDEES
jgi:hypothetical protein